MARPPAGGGPPAPHLSDQSVEDEYEATSAFYRKATFHRAAPGSTPSPLILEELPIEPFDGDIRRYPMFRNRFLDVAEGHRKMPPRHKLQYLLQFLRGEPLQLANNFQLTDANYYIIIDRLEEQYGDEYRLRQLLAQDFIAMRPPAGSVADLRRFHDVAFRIATELQTLDENIDGTVLYEQALMAKLPMKLREEIVRNSEYCRKRTVTSILDGLRKYAKLLDEVSNCGNLFGPPAPAAPEAPCQERRPPPARSPSECSTEESTECSTDTSDEQPTVCVANAVLTELVGLLKVLNKRTEAQWRCQLCGQPHTAANCTTYATVVKRLRRIKKLGLCLHCLTEGHRAESCPQRETVFCQNCPNGSHHRAICMEALDGTRSGSLRRSSKCATRGSRSDPKRSVPKRHAPTTREERTVTTSVVAARKPRLGTQSSPAKTRDNPKKRHAPVKKAVHRSDAQKVTSTAQTKVPPSAPRQDRENKPRASPAREDEPRAPPRTQGPSRNGTNSTKIYRKKESGNAGTSSQGRGSTTRPSTTLTDESKQKAAEANGNVSLLATHEDLLQTARCSTNTDPPRLDRPAAGFCKPSIDDWDPFGDEPRDEDESYPESSGHCSDAPSEPSYSDDYAGSHKSYNFDEDPWADVRSDESLPESIGHCSDAPIGPSDVESDDYERFPAYKEVRAYVASASTNDAHAPLLECTKVTAVNPTTGATRNVIVFFDGGSDFSYIAPTLARELDMPLHGKCVLRVNTFGTPAPLTAEGFSTSVVLCSPQGRHVSLGATTSDFAIPSVRTALVKDADLPSLRRNERHLTPSQVTPDILIGQDRIQLFGRENGPRLPAGYDITHTILGPMIGGAPQVVSSQPKALSSSSVEVSGPPHGSIVQQPSDTADVSSLRTIASSSYGPSNRLPRTPTDVPTSKPASVPLTEKGLDSPPPEADDQPCRQFELRGDTTSTTLCAEQHPLLERTERWDLLRRKRNPLDTARPSQPGLHSTYAVLQHKLQLGHRLSAEDDQQTPATSQHGPLPLGFDPPTRPVEAVMRALNTVPPFLVVCARVAPMSPDVQRDTIFSAVLVSGHTTMTEQTSDSHAPPEHSAGGIQAGSTRDHHQDHHDDNGEDAHYADRALLTNGSTSTRPSASRLGPLSVVDSAAAKADDVPQQLTRPSTLSASRFGPLPVVDSTAAEVDEAPPQTIHHSRPSASRLGPLSVVDSAAAKADDVPQQLTRPSTLSASRLGPLPVVDSTAAEAVTTPQHSATQTKSARSDPGPLPEKDRGVRHAAMDARKQADAVPTPALALLVPVARADPKDQEDNAFHVAPSTAANTDRARVPGCPPTSATLCARAKPLSLAEQATAAPRLPADDTTSSAARTPSEALTAKQHSSVARRLPAEATQGQAASTQHDDTHVRRTTRDDSPLKNETVCFCDGTTFLYFGCLLRPEVLMILTPMSSFEGALRSVCDFHPNNEVKRVIFWMSDSHATPLCTADQLRLVVELSRHYAAQYPTVMQYVVATPVNGSRQDVWTCGLFKLLVQMQVLLPSAQLILRPRGSRSVTWIGVHYIKLYLRDYYHLNLWSDYNADSLEAVEALYFPARLRQLAMPGATASADRLTVEAPDAARPWNQHQRQLLPIEANSNPKDGPLNAATLTGLVCPPNATGSRRHNDMRDGSATQPIVQFPPPPSRSTFRSTPLSASLDPAQALKRKSRSRSKPAVLAVREPPKTNPSGKKKEHAFRDEVYRRSMDKLTPAAPAVTSKKPAKPKPSKSRSGPLPIVDQTVAKAAEGHDNTRQRNVCAFCDHTHWSAKCTVYRSRTQRVRRARELGYCFTCLRPGHMRQACPSRTSQSCRFCKGSQHHRALCPLSTSNGGSMKQTAPRRPPPSTSAPGATTTVRAAAKVAKKCRKPARAARTTDAPSAAPIPPTSEPAESHHRRKPRKRKDREPTK